MQKPTNKTIKARLISGLSGEFRKTDTPRRIHDHRREFLKTAAGPGSPPSFLPQSAPASERPNFLFMIADDLLRGVSAMGNPEVQTPNLDRLMKRGCTFTHASIRVRGSRCACASRTMLNCGLTLSAREANRKDAALGRDWARPAMTPSSSVNGI